MYLSVLLQVVGLAVGNELQTSAKALLLAVTVGSLLHVFVADMVPSEMAGAEYKLPKVVCVAVGFTNVLGATFVLSHAGSFK